MSMCNDSLYRISLKCLIKNNDGKILVVKESGREFWDLPGGGVEYGEGILSAVARELKEEVGNDVDEIQFINPILFKNSESESEQKIYEYTNTNS